MMAEIAPMVVRAPAELYGTVKFIPAPELATEYASVPPRVVVMGLLGNVVSDAPMTSRKWAGAIVPMPTFPPLLMIMRSAALLPAFLVPKRMAQPFVMRATLIGAGPGRHLFVLVMHHIISDGVSVEILLSELSAVYLAETTGVPASLPPLWMEYGDYAVWQQDRMRGEEPDHHLAAKEYGEMLKEKFGDGGLDLCMLGMGDELRAGTKLGLGRRRRGD